MRKVLLFSVLLILGLVGSQLLPRMVENFGPIAFGIRLFTMVGLGFIMIHVGYEFEVDKKNPGKYAWDYLVAATAAAFPWIFVSFYFVFAMISREGWGNLDVWKEILLASRFSSPTSAGVLFSMLAAAGLSASWVFQKARVLAIFDDLDTVLLLIPLQIWMTGFRWQLMVILVIVTVLLWGAWRFLHEKAIPVSWPWVLGYSVAMTAAIEVFYSFTKIIDPTFPIHIEILLPAFALGCIMARPATAADPHSDDAVEGHQEGPVEESEQRVSTIIAACFMAAVGLSMPVFIGEPGDKELHPAIEGAVAHLTPDIGWGMVAFHVLMVTVLSNVGKMFPSFCYRSEAPLRERIALGVGMWPRGEVGAGVLVLSLSYGINGPVMLVAMLCLAVNLLCTGVFIAIIKRLIAVPESPADQALASS
ncbi:MAG: hypothetical protein JNG89_20340 [Planctomycetaceae bacterium]|nr:hypothetical protein [Planctomycetaceae bacterium]